MILAEASVPGDLDLFLKRKEKRRKSGIEKWSSVDRRQRNEGSRSWSLTAPATLPDEQAAAALPCIQHILDANRLTWSDVGHHPDCLFAIFLHASQQQEPNGELIIDTPTKCRNLLRLNPQISFLKRGRKDAMYISSSNRGW